MFKSLLAVCVLSAVVVSASPILGADLSDGGLSFTELSRFTPTGHAAGRTARAPTDGDEDNTPTTPEPGSICCNSPDMDRDTNDPSISLSDLAPGDQGDFGLFEAMNAGASLRETPASDAKAPQAESTESENASLATAFEPALIALLAVGGAGGLIVRTIKKTRRP